MEIATLKHTIRTKPIFRNDLETRVKTMKNIKSDATTILIGPSRGTFRAKSLPAAYVMIPASEALINMIGICQCAAVLDLLARAPIVEYAKNKAARIPNTEAARVGVTKDKTGTLLKELGKGNEIQHNQTHEIREALITT
jgi:hypothetical protein